MGYYFKLEKQVNQFTNGECPHCQGKLVVTVWEEGNEQDEKEYKKLFELVLGLTMETHKQTMLQMLRECRRIDKPEQRVAALDKLLRTFMKLRDDEIASGAAMPPMIVWKEKKRGEKIAEEGYDTTGMPADKGEGK